MANKIPATAVLTSITRRLERFLENAAIRVRDWYEPIAKQLLAGMAGREIRLIVDGSKVGFGHQLLVVALAYRRRSLPLCWTWVRGSRGHSSTRTQLALLSYVQGLLPKDAKVLLIGDSEFGAVEVLKQLDAWRWKYVLRQKSSHLVRAEEGTAWRPLGSFLTKAGQSLWLGRLQLTQLHAYAVNLLAHWQVGEDEPWLLATNLLSLREALRAYARRMWIEAQWSTLRDVRRSQGQWF